jgi:hypothetical protein
MTPRRETAAPKKAPAFNLTIPTLLSILSIAFGVWNHFDSREREQSRESGVLLTFKEHEAKTDDTFREALRRIADRLTAHMSESEAEHREMRRDLEGEFRRDVDQACGQCRETTERKK